MADTTQSTFDFNPPIGGAVGELADYETHMSGKDESFTASVAIPFGRGVTSAAATPNVCALPTDAGTAARFQGIAVRTQAKASGAGYAVAEEVRVLRTGRVRVYFETAMADLAQPYIRITESATGAGDTGQFRADSATGAAIACPGCRVRSRNGVISAAGIGVLELDLEGVKV